MLGGGKIIIGQGSLLSNNIEIHNTDYHGIYNLMGERINPEKDITIGKSVWVGFGSKILKGTHLSDYSIVGCGSLVSGNFAEKCVIIAGNPARVIKSEVFWNHQLENLCPVPEDL